MEKPQPPTEPPAQPAKQPATAGPQTSSPLQEVVREQNPAKIEKGYRVKDEPVPMVTFYDGAEGKSLAYMDLQEIQWLKLTPRMLKCIFSGWEVVLEGHRLVTLWEDLCAHLVVRIDADPRAADLTEKENTCYATAIKFIERNPDEEALEAAAHVLAGAGEASPEGLN